MSARQLKVTSSNVTEYVKDYTYNDEIKIILNSLKEENKSSHLTFFLTPMSKPLYCYLVKEGYLPAYERLIRDLIAVNGEVYNFMYVNPITADDSNFFDVAHFYPKVGTLIARKITGENNGSSNFGILVTQSNLDDHIKFIRENATACSD